MKLLASIGKFLNELLSDDQANSTFIEKIEIFRDGNPYIVLECRRDQDGLLFGIFTIDGDDIHGSVALGHREFSKFVRGMRNVLSS